VKKKTPAISWSAGAFSLFRHRHSKGTSMPNNIDTDTAIVKSVRASLPELANVIRTEHAAVAQAANNVLTLVLAIERALIAAHRPGFEAWGNEVGPIDGVAP
jgi:hypothetical protein